MMTKPVVAATDGSEESLRAVEWAAREATLHGAPLRIVSAAEVLSGMMEHKDDAQVDTVADVLRHDRDGALATAVKRAAAVAPDLLIDTGQLSGPIAQAVTASGSGASMLVVGSRGTGAFAAMILGSVSRYVATHASCPAVVVRDQTPAPHRKVFIGVRDVDTCDDALAFAFEEAAVREAELTAIYAWHAPHFSLPSHGANQDIAESAARQLTALLVSWRDKYPAVQVSQHVVHGHPGRVLSGVSAQADLVVLGRRPPHGSGEHGAGTVTHALLSHAHGPIVTVPSAGVPAADAGS
jgi:nucleotide-binding universal stress UspA family protein